MALNLYNIKKWIRMLSGKSILHVNQNMGSEFVPGELRGYFNNMTEKVTKLPELLTCEDVPTVITENGDTVVFPVAVFQYGLGAYDLYLKTQEQSYFEKFRQTLEWTITNQESSGAWNNFFFCYPAHPYGAMCQGEAVSLLLRGYKEFNDEFYLNAAKKAVEFMLTPADRGGTAEYVNGKLCLLEYSHLPAVLNGWVFAIFGLYDMTIVCRDTLYTKALDNTLNYLTEKIEVFDCNYWSMYDMAGKIASPFYHNLHIAQMQALYAISGKDVFKKYQIKWSIQQKNIFNKSHAFLKKAIQKVIEK